MFNHRYRLLSPSMVSILILAAFRCCCTTTTPAAYSATSIASSMNSTSLKTEDDDDASINVGEVSNSARNASSGFTIDIPAMLLTPPIFIVPAARRYECAQRSVTCNIVTDSALLLPDNADGWTLDDLMEYVLVGDPVNMAPEGDGPSDPVPSVSSSAEKRKEITFESFGSFSAPTATDGPTILYRVWLLRNLSQMALGWYNVNLRDPRNSSRGTLTIGLLNITDFDLPVPTNIGQFGFGFGSADVDLPNDPCQVRLIVLTTFFGTALAVLVILILVSIIGTLRLPKFDHLFCGICCARPSNSPPTDTPVMATMVREEEEEGEDERRTALIIGDHHTQRTLRRSSSAAPASSDGSPPLELLAAAAAAATGNR